MKIVLRHLNWLILIAITIVFSSSIFAQDEISVSNTHEILITPVRRSEFFGDSQKGDEAMLIRDKAEIAKFVALFDKNVQAKVHACGYHWRLTFFRSGLEPTEIYFNEQCEKFERNTDAICDIVQSKFRQTVTAPNRYLTNLEIDVNRTPEAAKGILTSQGAMFVVALDKIKRLPYVEIRASSSSQIPNERSLWDIEKEKVIRQADQKLIGDLVRIREKYKVVEIGEINHGMSMFGGGEIFEQRRMNIYFDIGTDLASVGKLLNKSKVESTYSPVTYSMQILTEHRLTKADQEALQQKFSFVKAIEAYKG